jgi:hypothetical protein
MIPPDFKLLQCRLQGQMAPPPADAAVVHGRIAIRPYKKIVKKDKVPAMNPLPGRVYKPAVPPALTRLHRRAHFVSDINIM